MVNCWAVNCFNRSERGVRMHNFPRDLQQRDLWHKLTRRVDSAPTNSARLCQAHFTADQYENNRLDGKRKLKRNAIPTVFDFSPSSRKSKGPNKKSLGRQAISLSAAKRRVNPRNLCGVTQLITAAQVVDSRSPRFRNAETKEGEGTNKTVDTTKPTSSVAIPIVVHRSLLKSLGPGTILKQIVQPQSMQQKSRDKGVIRVERVPLTSKSRRAQLLKSRSCCAAQVQLAEMQAKMMNERRRAQRSLKKLTDQNSHLSVVFNPDQLEALTRSSTQGLKWQPETILQAREIFAVCGRKGYEKLLELGFPLPTPRTLERAKKEALKEAQADIERTFIKDTEEAPSTVPDTEPSCA